MTYKYWVLVLVLTLGLVMGTYSFVHGQTAAQKKIDYQGQPVLDNDLDGLTDRGEEELFHTNPQRPDTDGDGILDGAEVIGNTDPLNPNPPIEQPQRFTLEETPWAWYVTRASGLIAFFLLYVAFLVGVAIRIPWLRKLFSWFQVGSFHCWVSLQALLFTFLHAGALLFDRYLKFTLQDILIPFAAPQYTNLIAAGVLGMYLMMALVVSSYARRKIPYWLWRVVHAMNIILYILVFIHAVFLGTDLKHPLLKNTFWGATALLLVLMLFNLGYRIRSARIRKAEGQVGIQ